ncbi:MAG: hypothetical protein DMG95_06465 [Acidobacteria bacterium]|nr:MAG: hypothetical protein DMG94_06745 [Acidobacteriota bacterium]PYV63618.1 MAG: hypothetical protein DMG95_06465 [Acidobacteriota bacterium]
MSHTAGHDFFFQRLVDGFEFSGPIFYSLLQLAGQSGKLAFALRADFNLPLELLIHRKQLSRTDQGHGLRD